MELSANFIILITITGHYELLAPATKSLFDTTPILIATTKLSCLFIIYTISITNFID